MTELSDVNLTLFFTAGVGLNDWEKTGNLHREIEIYKRLDKDLKKINFITYNLGDKKFQNQLYEINILPTIWFKLPGTPLPTLTQWMITQKYAKQLIQSHIFKTNQISGAEVPINLAKKYGKKIIVRCGFLHSEFIKKQAKNEKIIRREISLEKKAFQSADLCVVTSLRDKMKILNSYFLNEEKIKVIPNYVDTDVFRFIPEIEKKYDIVYVGRSAPQKNLKNFVKAVKLVKSEKKDISVLMVGDCCNDLHLINSLEQSGVNVTAAGNVPNQNLPNYLNQSRAFILPSLYEGHPKSLLEAMSCGLTPIASNVEGIKEDIQDGKTGFLCETNPKSIADKILQTLNDEKQLEKIGKNARKYITERYSLDKIKDLELEALNQVIS